jgi:hypothetical protein
MSPGAAAAAFRRALSVTGAGGEPGELGEDVSGGGGLGEEVSDGDAFASPP